jgi:hypothetical protein
MTGSCMSFLKNLIGAAKALFQGMILLRSSHHLEGHHYNIEITMKVHIIPQFRLDL